MDASHPILNSHEAKEWESYQFGTAEDEWLAMAKVGRALASEIVLELGFGRGVPRELTILALVGKGHNGGDAMLALAELARRGRVRAACLVLSCSKDELKENTKKALEEVTSELSEERLKIMESHSADDQNWGRELEECLGVQRFDLSIDGFLGMSFQSPLSSQLKFAAKLLNSSKNIGLKVAVDLPTGVGDDESDSAIWAHVTVATGICKYGACRFMSRKTCGAIRYLDIGLFERNPGSFRRVVTDRILEPLRERRPAHVDKRSFGHIAILAGSRHMSGAIAMSVRAALRSGVGLVTVFAPESVVRLFTAEIPEAIWVGWPETPDGHLALEGEYLLSRHASKATALLVGPGIGHDRETSALVRNIAIDWLKPLVLDADALTQDVMFSLCKRMQENTIVTPHLGEFFRMSGEPPHSKVNEEVLQSFTRGSGLVTLLKGPNTRIASRDNIFMNTTGNGVLSRGGSGDILAGLIAGLLARLPMSPIEVACMGAYWHGRAGDLLAFAQGQNAVRTTQLLDWLAPALETSSPWET